MCRRIAGERAFKGWRGSRRAVALDGLRISVLEPGAIEDCCTDVDLQDGGKVFPDRVVGRCAAATHEHDFSFDPALLRGCTLLPLPRGT